MSQLLFVYGTLKDGFPNAGVNSGVRIPGVFVTVERLPLFLVGRRNVPWLIDRSGEGEHVCGQLFEADASALSRMDALERVAEPDGYKRRELTVRSVAEPLAAGIRAQAYFKAPGQLTDTAPRIGPLAEYTLAHAAMYRPRDNPSVPPTAHDGG